LRLFSIQKQMGQKQIYDKAISSRARALHTTEKILLQRKLLLHLKSHIFERVCPTAGDL
jgi:hypothetical protein